MPVGQIRLDYKDPKEAEISISILKEFQGRGFTTKALSLTIKMVKNKNKVKLLIAVIHKKNISSQRIFEKFNFGLRTKKEKWLKYILEI